MARARDGAARLPRRPPRWGWTAAQLQSAAVDAPGIQRAHDCYVCLMGMASLFLENSATDHANRIAAWLRRAEALHDQALRKETSAWLRYEQGRLAELTGDAASAAIRYREAYAIHPHPESSAGVALRRLGLSLP